ncbi:predicted protein [Lichtheimia corymbifera JMRC:FSU:9682]|uniref:Uncharacterized protein n=1 Tax=Lichtheimia corymbifera JMRC:FSU:9682 TaxID=1263082 RepID=A0A068SFW4_9FUNG|nr:predicted protein [Lichtheimia corymbifera JMRC:FSU:9682]
MNKVKDMDAAGWHCLKQDNKLVQFIGDGDGTIQKDVIAYFKTTCASRQGICEQGINAFTEPQVVYQE